MLAVSWFAIGGCVLVGVVFLAALMVGLCRVAAFGDAQMERDARDRDRLY